MLASDCSGPPPASSDCASPTTFFSDSDGDGYGGPATRQACDAPAGFVELGGDCDDEDAARNPGVAVDGCNSEDDDCDGSIDEDVAHEAYWPDADGDGFGDESSVQTQRCEGPAAGWSDNDTDCDDGNASVHPGAAEQCNELDDDCDGEVDVGAVDGVAQYDDFDGDGYGDDASLTYTCDASTNGVGGDCDDGDASIHPDAEEACNAIDDDCDGVVDDGLAGIQSWPDADGDGFGDGMAASIETCVVPAGRVADDTDCDDSSASTWPGAPELCNSEDDDCDGTWDDELVDSDGDGFSICDDDCDDGEASVYPGAEELCDVFDNDCNGVINDPWSDAWEPNDVRSAAPRIANDDETVVILPRTTSPTDTDWFEMDTVDDPGSLFMDGFEAWATVEDIPAGVELALHLYRNDVFGVTNLVDSDTTWDDGLLEVSRGGVIASNDGNLYFIEVEVLDGFSCDETYTLTVGNTE